MRQRWPGWLGPAQKPTRRFRYASDTRRRALPSPPLPVSRYSLPGQGSLSSRLVARPPPALDLTRAPPRRRGDRARAPSASSRRTEEDHRRSRTTATRALVVAPAAPAASSIGDLAARSSVPTDSWPGYQILSSSDADADGRS